MKIAHISDLHFGMHLPAVLDAFIESIHKIEPEIVIISGDVTQRAKNYQFELLCSFLGQVPGTILVVPGNHDVPFYNFWARLIHPFKTYNNYIGKHFKTEFCNDEIAILGVNSVNPLKGIKGKLTNSVLDKINSFFVEKKKNSNILFFHHNFDHIEGLHKPLENESQFLSYLRQSNIDVVCTGHLHYANVGLIRKNTNRVCLVLHAGSLLCSRKKDNMNSYFSIDINAEQCSVDWHVFRNNQFEIHKNYTVNFADKEFKLKFEDEDSGAL
ncbi:metallophosphoesterase family protein [Legionella brunensis]|uniref:3',5'-cyclic-nucleotide phosphodiesterase n=1 Tax=Legionella brunensis TaxID=29422 RepID=A0A0W0S4H9_9GAMM|nr:metallophosphoesterase [Legionella brunensis]KTC77961.1 3',5'-cyclic-nucleotide phosphodiesterase [Legionella brunensis]